MRGVQSRRLDITGQRFGMLVAIEPTSERDFGSIKWRFKCDCGSETVIGVRCVNLLGQKSCGCIKRAAVEPVGLMGLIKFYRANAKAHKHVWDLSVDLCRDLFFGKCLYCGVLPSREFVYTGVNPPVTVMRNGIDRVDPTKGYIAGNVVTCCWRCNFMKGSMEFDEFIEHINRIYQKWA